jgi:hypothetical protein
VKRTIKCKDEFIVKDNKKWDNLYTRAKNINGQLHRHGLGEMGLLERGVLNVAPTE